MNIYALHSLFTLHALPMPTVQQKIIHAAQQRFADYGPSKTTMSEIAKDCDMSVGNLYRHFEHKHALLTACLQQHLEEKLAAGLAASTECDDAWEALRAFLHTRLRLGHDHISETRHGLDMLVAIESGHRDVLLAYEEKVIAALADILAQGVAQHLLACSDVQQTAYDVHQACLRYNIPITLQHHPLDVLSHDLDRLLHLLYQGLQAR